MHSESIKKMGTSLKDTVHYYFSINNIDYFMNDLIGSRLNIEWKGKVFL